MTDDRISGEIRSHPVHLSAEGLMLENARPVSRHYPYQLELHDYERIKYAYSGWAIVSSNLLAVTGGWALSKFLDALPVIANDGLISVEGSAWVFLFVFAGCVLFSVCVLKWLPNKRTDTMKAIEAHFASNPSKKGVALESRK